HHREFDVVQYVDHDDVCGDAGRKRQMLCVGLAIEPGRELDIGRNDVTTPALEVPDARADLDGQARYASFEDTVMEIVIDLAQNRLVVPPLQMCAQGREHRSLTAP